MKEREKIQVTVLDGESKKVYWQKKGSSLFELWDKGEEIFFSNCGGKGLCGNCRVRFLKGAVLPGPGDRAVFTPEELRQGFRLACLSKPIRDCEIELCFQKEKKISVVTETSSVKGQKQGMGEFDKGNVAILGLKEDTIIAIDLGTTTIAMELRGINTLKSYDNFCKINPQRKYGADVISRIQASNHSKNEKENLERIVRTALEKGVLQFFKTAERKGLCKPKAAYLSGNTVMGQLFMGHSVEKLGHYPFLPENIGRQETSLLGMKTIVMPGISAFVGGDIASGLYYVRKQGGFCGEKASLFIDLGTNGEMAIGNGRSMLVTATAAGPAFEGGSGETIMGADLIACLDELKEQGILDETGLLKEPWFENGIHIGAAVLKGKDVRALQMAKAAVFAGICILIDRYGVKIEDIEQVYLAGGFGYFLNVKSAVAIGLIPIELSEKVTAVGNTSLAGAFLYGKDCIAHGAEGKEQQEYGEKGRKKRLDALEKLIETCRTLNLAEEEQFQKLYIQAMALKPLSYREIKKELEQEREGE